MSYKATSPTIGRSSAGEHKPYRYGGNRPLEDITERQMAGSRARTARREEKIREFAVILAELGYPDPVEAPNLACVEAGKRVGVGDKTAKSYRTALKQQREREQQCEGCPP